MGKTTNLGLHTTATNETSKTFLEYRTELSGTGADSNMNIIDKAYGDMDDKIDTVNDTLDAKIDANKQAETDKFATLDDTVSGIQSSLSKEVTARTSGDQLLNTRIDELVAPSGEAPSAAEVQDARVGVDSTTYASLGAAIRGQVSNLKNDTNASQAAQTQFGSPNVLMFCDTNGYQSSTLVEFTRNFDYSWTITGQSPESGVAIKNIYSSAVAFPFWAERGSCYRVDYESNNVALRVYYVDSDSQNHLLFNSYHGGMFVIPTDNVYGFVVRFVIDANKTVDETVTPIIRKMPVNGEYSQEEKNILRNITKTSLPLESMQIGNLDTTTGLFVGILDYKYLSTTTPITIKEPTIVKRRLPYYQIRFFDVTDPSNVIDYGWYNGQRVFNLAVGHSYTFTIFYDNYVNGLLDYNTAIYAYDFLTAKDFTAGLAELIVSESYSGRGLSVDGFFALENRGCTLGIYIAPYDMCVELAEDSPTEITLFACDGFCAMDNGTQQFSKPQNLRLIGRPFARKGFIPAGTCFILSFTNRNTNAFVIDTDLAPYISVVSSGKPNIVENFTMSDLPIVNGSIDGTTKAPYYLNMGIRATLLIDAPIVLPFDVVITPSVGYFVSVVYYKRDEFSSDAFHSEAVQSTVSYLVPSGQYFTLIFGKRDNSTVDVTDVKRKFTVETILPQRGLTYYGEKVNFKKNIAMKAFKNWNNGTNVDSVIEQVNERTVQSMDFDDDGKLLVNTTDSHIIIENFETKEVYAALRLPHYATHTHSNACQFAGGMLWTSELTGTQELSGRLLVDTISETDGTYSISSYATIRYSGTVTSDTSQIIDGYWRYVEPREWLVDYENKFVYMVVGDLEGSKYGGTLHLYKFNLPSLSQGDNVLLGDSDIVDSFTLSEKIVVLQGVKICNGYILVCDGCYNVNHSNYVYVYDRHTLELRTVFDLTGTINSEIEDVAFKDGMMYVLYNSGRFGTIDSFRFD